jgi:hypothetical protein
MAFRKILTVVSDEVSIQSVQSIFDILSILTYH